MAPTFVGESLKKPLDDESLFSLIASRLESRPDGNFRLTRYVQAGHTLGNHGHAHLALSTTPLLDYLADLDRATELLDSFDGVAPFFRHPYLDEGSSRMIHHEIDSALARRGLRRGHVTVATYDFYLQDLLDEAIASRALVNFDWIREVYVGLITGCIEFYDALAMRVIGRSPAHVLLLHENDLAALFVADLVGKLSVRGWHFVPAAEPMMTLSSTRIQRPYSETKD
jgi:peptidoglycan/xylan/chitin deacetylase (PgdA/CDA1 family)